jgi:hypothetical protein
MQQDSTPSPDRTADASEARSGISEVSAALQVLYKHTADALWWVVETSHPSPLGRSSAEQRLREPGAAVAQLAASAASLLQAIDDMPDFELDKT